LLIYQLKTTYSILEQQIHFITDIQIPVLNAVIEREERHTQIYTGSLKVSYIQVDEEKRLTAEEEVEKLLSAEFIREDRYTT